MDRYDWIIGVCSSEASGVRLLRYRGSITEAKEKLISLIAEDKANDEENWYGGCETVDDISSEDNGLGYELYGYGNYQDYDNYRDYHIEYTAKEFAHIDHL